MRRTFSVALAMALTATACGGSGTSNGLEAAIKAETGQNVDVQQNGDSLTIDTEDGSITFSGDGTSSDISTTDADGNDFSIQNSGEVPPDFPLPVPDNIEVSRSTTYESPEGKSWGLIFDFDPSRVDEVVALYENELNSLGLTVESGSGGGSEDGTMMVGNSDTLYVIVMVTNFGDYWEANISWTPM